MRYNSLVACLILAVLTTVGEAGARTSDMKQLCVSCHTMHNSQNGVSGSQGLHGALLNTSCYGCHSDTISHVDTPVVLHISTPPIYMATGTENGHNTLAGGDFYWVSKGANLKGHNIDGVATQEPPRTPPGGSKWFDSATPLNCAGVNGCHGDLSKSDELTSMYQTHHSAEGPINGASVANSFRFINGILGYEDPGYELTSDLTHHNQYKGVARSVDNDSATSISHSCAGCHGMFHFGVGAAGVSDGSGTLNVDPWLRHPVDYAMELKGEFLGYGGNGINNYNVVTPLGFDPIPSSVVQTVTGSGDTIITCISCHRAHGSPYDYSLRWDYKNWPGAGYNGCGDCHTAKN